MCDTVGVTVFRDFGEITNHLAQHEVREALMCVIGIAKHFAGAAIWRAHTDVLAAICGRPIFVAHFGLTIFFVHFPSSRAFKF